MLPSFLPYYLSQKERKHAHVFHIVTPLPGKTAGEEVMVQGRQIKAVTALLAAKGVPAQWIRAEDLKGGKK